LVILPTLLVCNPSFPAHSCDIFPLTLGDAVQFACQASNTPIYLITCVTNNLPGALWAHLVPTVIVLAGYFCIADVILIIQCLYYSKFMKSTTQDSARGRSSTPSSPSEHSPLLSPSPSHSETGQEARSTSRAKRTASKASSGLPGSLRRLSSVGQPPHPSTLTKDWEASTEDENSWSRNILSILAVIAVGIAGWAFAWKSGAWQPVEEPGNVVDGTEVALGAEILGYISACAYLVYVSAPAALKLLTHLNLVHEYHKSTRTGLKSPAKVIY